VAPERPVGGRQILGQPRPQLLVVLVHAVNVASRPGLWTLAPPPGYSAAPGNTEVELMPTATVIESDPVPAALAPAAV
jgi:hypothetical protein